MEGFPYTMQCNFRLFSIAVHIFYCCLINVNRVRTIVYAQIYYYIKVILFLSPVPGMEGGTLTDANLTNSYFSSSFIGVNGFGSPAESKYSMMQVYVKVYQCIYYCVHVMI